MKNIPKKIYLQVVGGDATVDDSIDDWNDLLYSMITWSDHRINDTDIEFVFSDVAGQSEQLLSFLEWYDSNVCQNDCRSREDLVKDFLNQ